MSVLRSEPESIWSLGAPLLEGPAWCARDAALWFVDIKLRRIFRLDPASGHHQSWDVPEQIGFCLPERDGDFIVGLQIGLARFDPASGTFTPLTDPEPDQPGNRINDGVVDPRGRLWFGTMDDGECLVSGRIYRLDHDGRCTAVAGPVPISNGPAVSPDGRTLYHVDTLAGLVHACTIDDDGSLSDPRIFARIASEDGFPDGPTCDSEGCVWVGLYSGAAVRRYAPSGKLLETVRFPVGAITKVAFGGATMTTVFATTAAKHLDDTGRSCEPQAGDLFAFEVDVPGLASPEISIGTSRR